MNKKKILIILLMICFICRIQAVSSAEIDANGTDDILTTDTEVVNESSDLLVQSTIELDDTLSEGEGSFSDLQTDILNGGSDITLTRNYIYTDSDSSLKDGIPISGSITIRGNGNVVIDGNNQARIFNVARESTITLIGITFINANSGTLNGGAIYANGTIHVDNCKFINNTGNRGGALYLEGHDGTISNSEFENNTAENNGGAIRVEGSNWRVEKSTFNNNKATNGSGGAIYLEESLNTVVDTCEFKDNFAGINGGAVEWYDYAHDGQLLNSMFTNNIANRSGGAAFWYGERGIIRNVTFIDNKAMGLVESINSFGNLTYGGHGGAVMWIGAYGTIDNCTFSSNTAATHGGAIFMQGSVKGDCHNITVSNSIFEDNFAGVNGGAVDWYKGAHDCTLVNATFNNNIANRSGGAVYWFGQRGTIKNAVFIDNYALGNVSYENSFGVNTTGGHGGAVMWTGAYGTIDNCNFTGNDAVTHGGAIFMQGSTEGNCSNIIISNIICENNFAGVNGGAVDWYKGAHDCVLENATFNNNIANRSGGAVFWFGQHGTIKNAVFTNNSALGNVSYENSFGVNTTGGHGGAVMWTGADGLITNSEFYDNKAKVNGGAIFMQGSTEGNCSNVTISNSIFEDNFAGVNGGAVDWYKGAHDCILENSNFNNNIANRSGGAVYWFGQHGTIKNSSFTNNSALGNVLYNNSYGNMTYGGHGGAIMWTGADGTIDDCTFVDNEAKVNGGAIFLQGSTEGNCHNITINLGVFERNIAGENGGAVDFYQGATNGTIINSKFTENNATTGKGGAVFWNGYLGHVINSSFTKNYAQNDGGALYVEGDNTTISNINLNNNTAGDDGGAIYWTGNYGGIYNLTANNNRGISHGDLHSKGGTLIITGSNMTIDTIEVTKGYAEVEGGGLFLTGNNVNITNAKFFDCYVNTDFDENIGGALDIIGNNTCLINATIVNATAKYGGAIDWAGNDGYVCNLTVSKGYATEDGGALRIEGKNFTIYDSQFNDNVAGDDGGAIEWKGDNGIAHNLTFNNNKGIGLAGTTSNGGSISLEGSNVTIEDSTFTNSASEIAGGAIFVTGNNVNITGSSFEKCNVSMDKLVPGKDYTTGGGAIYVLGNYTHIVNCTFDDSHGREGGVIYVDGRNAVIDNATSINSYALNGGAIYIDGINAIVSNSDISLSNVSLAGGAVYINGVYASVINSTFNSTYANDAGTYGTANLGGAIYINGDYANIHGSEFEDSDAYQGGALYLAGNYCNVTNSSVKGGYAYMSGGALYSTGSYSNVYYSNFTSSEAGGDGGAMHWFGGRNSRNNTIVGCIFLENVAYANSNSNTKGGGAIYWSEGGYYGTIRDSQFINNSVQSNNKADGGAILWDKCHFAVIDNCTFDGDFITTSNGGDVWVQGGAIYLRVDDPYTISNSRFINCYSEKEAGALYIQSNTDGRKIFIVNTTFINNAALAIGRNVNGGGAVQIKTADVTIFQNVTFINNTANQGGAATILDTKNNVTFINCTFDGNEANNGNGGAIWANKKFYMYNTLFSNNVASAYGGALYTNADLIYDHMTFINNTAERGGGLYWNKASIKIQNMDFINNTATNRAGAVYVTTSNVQIENVNMTGNKAFTGSAIWADKDITLNNVYLMENQANSSSLTIDFNENTGKIVVLFKGLDKYLNAIYLNGGCILYCTNVTYWDESGVTNTGPTRTRIPNAADPTPEGGQNLTVRIYGENGLLAQIYNLTDNDGKIYLDLKDILPDIDESKYGELYAESELVDDSYYTIIKVTTRSTSEVNASANKTTYHSNSTIYVNVTQGATGNVSVYIGETFLGNITLNNSKGLLNISTLIEGEYLPAGNHTLTVIYNGNAKYDSSNTTVILEIAKITPTLQISVTGIGYNLLVNVTVMDGEYGIPDATGEVTIQVSDRIATIYLGNGQGMTVIYGLPIGNYTVNATYLGDNNYYNITNSTNASVTEKTQTVLVLDIDSERIYFINETVPIRVTILPNGEGNITLYINGEPHVLTLQTVGNSTFVEFNATELKEGVNHVFATYDGTTLYAPSWAQDTFNVIKYNSTININVEDIPVGTTEVINITLPEDAERIIKVLVNGTPYYVELVNGTAQVNVSGLGVGTYNVTVIFDEDKKYYNSTNSTLFNVTKIKPDITVEVANVTYNNDTIVVITLPDGVSGNVTIKLNNSVVFTEEPIDGKATFIIPDLAAGNYTIEATFNGNDDYLASSNTTKFTVFKATPILNVTVEDINYGGSANITVTIIPGVTGTIIIKVNGTESDPLTITDGKVNLTVNGLAVGNYPVEVIYSGNENYTDAEASTDFNVLPISTILDVEVHDIQVWDTEYINVTIKDASGAIITNATGNVTININGVDYTAEIKEGIARFNTSDLAIGHKIARVFYDGDLNLTGNKAMAEFDVGQRTPTINITAQNITVGQLGNITVNVPSNATGFVIIEVIGDDTYVRFVSEGKAIVNPKDLKVGNYTVKATYYGGNNDNYTIASAEPVNFTVSKLNATVSIDVDDINYTETAVVTVTVPEGVEGNITIKLNDTAGTTITLPIFNNEAVFELSDLAAGNYTVNVTYNGNDYYNINNTESATFEVKQISPEITIVSVVSNADDNATITVNVNPKVTENVTINVNSKDYTKAVGEDGVVVFTTDVLDYGTYTVTASYAGDKNFTGDSDSLEFTTNKTDDYLINITASDINVGDNTNITVNVPADAEGNVIINLNGTNYTCDINDGKAALNNISTLKEGIYTVTAYFGNDKYMNKTVETRFAVSKVDTPISIDVGPAHVGDTVEIVVTVPGDVTENVTIEIDGKVYTNITVNGNATFYVPNMTYGNKTVVATYAGDDKYRFNSTTANFEVTKRLPATIVVTTDGPIDVGENITITVDIPANATGYVVVNVNGTNYTINTTSGHGSVVIPNLGNGTWNVTATYLGDDQYLPGSNKTSFIVNKISTTVVIDVESIDYGNAANITVTVKDDATGYITININNTRNITLPVINGKVNWIVEGLAADNYTVYANYSGDAKYDENKSNVNKSFEVRQISPDLEIISVISDAADNATIVVKVDPRVTENVTINVNGKDYTKAVGEDGIVVFTTDVLDYGTYTVTANYPGDKNFTTGSDSLEFTTNKTDDCIINITASDINVGDNTNITVNVPADAEGNVIINLNGTNYTCDINDGKAVLNNISTLKEGVYTVTAYFGDSKYVNKTVETRFAVSKVDTPISIDVGPAHVGDTVEIVVTVPGDVTENVTIEIDGKVYTNITVNGNATFYVPDVTYGNKTVVATYAGDDKYRFNSTTANFEVTKRLPATIIVTTDGPINVGENITITVDIPANATGYVVVNVNGTNYTINTTSGHGSVVIPNLGNGTWNVTATYLGDDQYLPGSNKTSFVVNKVDTTVVIDVESIDYGNAVNITVTVKDDATGYITIQINNTRNITLPVINGKVNWIVEGLAADNYTVYANYSGDAKYNENNSNVNKPFEVRQISPDLEIVSVISNADDNATIIVKVDPRVTENVTINVNGKDYTKAVGEDGIVVFTTDVLDYDTYTVTASYPGDKNFTAGSDSLEFTTNITSDYSINITASDISVGNNTNITVNVPSDASGVVIINLNGTNYTCDINDGKAVLNNISTLKEGVYTVTAYFGDSKYSNKTVETRFVVSKVQTPITIVVDSIYVGDVAIINVTVPNDVENNVTIEIEGKKYSQAVDPTTGKAVFVIENLTAGVKTVSASYDGDDKYVFNSTTSLTVSKRNSTVNITVEATVVGSDVTINVTIPANATGFVVINVDGTDYTVNTTDGKGSLTIQGLGNSTHTVKVNYLGDDQYLPSNNETTFGIAKVNSTVTVKVEDITVGEVATVNITVITGATGNVTIKIGDEYEQTVGVIDGTISVIVSGLTVGDKTVEVTYNGDDKYLPSENSTTFTVNKITPKDSDIKVIDQGNRTVVVVVPENATGNVTIKVGNETYNATVVNGTAVVTLTNTTPGEHEITAIYSGDGNYTNATVNATVNIPKYDTPINVTAGDIYVGDTARITVELPENATGDVAIEIDGVKYEPVSFENGVAIFEVEDLTNGVKTVLVTYGGDYNYTANFTTANFTVNKRNSTVIITVEATSVGSDVTISVEIPANATGFVVINVDGTDYTVNTTDGIGSITIPGVGNTTHTVKATYLGDDQYLGSNNETTYGLSKVDSTIKVEAENITVGDAELITITVPGDATGNVTVEIVGVDTFTVSIANGTGILVVKDLKVDDYTVKVTYNGDEKYLPSDNETTFKVSKAVTEGIEVIDQGNRTVVVVVPGNATGNVTIKVGDETYNGTVVNGTAVITLTNTTPGEHDIEVIYSGDENHTNATVDAVVNIPKYDTPMSIEVQDGKVNETVEITVNVPEGVKDNVTIEIDGKTYTAKPENGKAVFTVEGLAAGDKTIAATYEGDHDYEFNSTTANFTVFKHPAPISVDVDNSTDGEVTITVTLPDDATGYVIVNVDGVDYGINLTNGNSVTIPIEDTGDYTAIVTYLGDDKYLDNSTTKDFHATNSKSDPNIAADVDNVPVGEDVVVKVTVPEDGDGTVTVTVDGITKTVEVTSGENSIPISGVSEGTHEVTIEYSGNEYYKPQTITKNVTVFRSIIAENITRGWNSPYDYKAEFLDSNGHVLADTEVQFIVDGKTYTAKTNSQGIAYLNTSKLDIGKYDVICINPVTGEQRNATTTIVKRLIENKDITMDYLDGTWYVVRAIGDDGKPVGEGEFIDIYVNTVHYSCRSDKDGYAKLKINLIPKTYKVVAEYKTYNVTNKLVVKKTVKVKKGKKLVLKAKLKWSSGKAIKGKKIVFKFKGKKYTAKTNKKGIAKVTIKKKVTKKLKKGKKYKYSAKYVDAIVKGKVKVKK